MRTTIMAAVIAAAIATSAGAATTVTSVAGPDSIGSGQTVLYDFNNFNSGIPAGFSGQSYRITSGTTPGVSAAPLGDNTPYLAVLGYDAGRTGVVFVNLPSVHNVSFYWGSIDSYNLVSFFTGTNSNGTELGSFTGSQIPGATADGTEMTTANNRRVFFDFGADTAQSIRFTGSTNAFEIDDIVTTAAVPEPTIWATLIAGFGLIGATARRRRRSSSVVAA